jgi:hypothetical protein
VSTETTEIKARTRNSKARRRRALPDGLLPLLSQPQLETYYDVGQWQIDRWVADGMPVEPFAGKGRRFRLDRVIEWHASRTAEAS